MLCLTIAMAVVTSGNPRKILALVFALCIVTVLANLATVMTRPPGPIGHEGIYSHKNSLGAAMALHFLFALYFLISTKGAARLVAMVIAAACIFLLFKSESKTAIGLSFIVPVVGTILYFLARWLRISPPVAVFFGFAVAVVLYVLASNLFGFDTSDLLLFVFKDATFTGRTYIWSFVWDISNNGRCSDMAIRASGAFRFPRSSMRNLPSSPVWRMAITAFSMLS